MDDEQDDMKMRYDRFAAMIATSTVVTFGLMYLNTYAPDPMVIVAICAEAGTMFQCII